MNKKVITFLSLLIVFTLSIIVIIFFSYDKKDRDEYSLKVPESLAIYIYNEKTEKYERKSEVPHGYELNTSKSYCKSGGEVVNYDSYHEYVNYALATDDRCYLYFDIYLPEGYTKLEYIERDSGQYINTGIGVTGNAETEVDIEWMYTKLNNYGTIIGTQGGSHNYILREENGTNVMHVWGGSTHVSLGTVVVGQRNSAKISWGNSAVSASLVLGNQGSNASASLTTETTSYPLFLFDSNVDGQLGSGINADITGHAKIYKCKISVNGELKRDFIPALNPQGEPGLYDRVGKQFYANAGSGRFAYEISGDSLPSDYTELEYIETNPSSGTQYIDTNYVPSSNTNITYDFEYVSGNSDSWIPIIGQRVNTSSMFALWIYSNSQYVAVNYGTVDNGSTTTVSSSGRHIFSNNGNSFYKDGTLMYTISTSAFTSAGSLIIMGLRESNNSSIQTRGLVGRVYSLKILESGVLVRNMIPALNKDGIPGMYDTVEGKFYTNAGSGQFKYSVNNNRLPSGYTAVSYIQATGTQYIDTGFTPNQDTAIQMTFKANTYADDGVYIYGSGNAAGSSAFELYPWGVNGTQYMEFNYGNNLAHIIPAPSTSDVVTIVQNKNNYTVVDGSNRTTQSYTYAAFTTPYTLTLAALHRSSVLISKGTLNIYSTKIWDNGVLVRDLVPCINPYGEVGMYDTVNEKFYKNSGTGAFNVGAPSEYTTLNYLESSGTQYIDTGYYAGSNTMLEVVASYTGPYSIYGGSPGTMNFTAGANGGYFYYLNGEGNSTITDLSNVVHTFKQDNNNAYIDGALYYTWTAKTFTDTNAEFLFARNNNGTINDAGGTVRIYSAKFWDNYKLVRYFVPSQDSTGTLGMYELLTDKFYTNAGSGTFASG